MLVPQLGDLRKDTLKHMKDEAFKAELFFGHSFMKGEGGIFKNICYSG